ncbi:hypothetical protein QVD17_02151 [Tagetes erecta]|uniref:TNase-like domain-containing protein n=1 Tax=Tagetes erecta TaxID=13708 RepID=A0AAD8L7P9_TARER|nr:hypothetical protein QVD17_02151 [Tagetes erecta]
MICLGTTAFLYPPSVSPPLLTNVSSITFKSPLHSQVSKAPEGASSLVIQRHTTSGLFYLPHSQQAPSVADAGLKFRLHTLPVDAKAVADGDTLTVYVSNYSKLAPNALHKQIKYRIRLRGIDAPESSMPYGKEAKDELVKMIDGKCLDILIFGEDRYGRFVGDVYCNGIFVQDSLLKKGLAWHYTNYDKRPELEKWEKDARAKRVGLWTSPNPEKPWEWRKNHRANRHPPAHT